MFAGRQPHVGVPPHADGMSTQDGVGGLQGGGAQPGPAPAGALHRSVLIQLSGHCPPSPSGMHTATPPPHDGWAQTWLAPHRTLPHAAPPPAPVAPPDPVEPPPPVVPADPPAPVEPAAPVVPPCPAAPPPAPAPPLASFEDALVPQPTAAIAQSDTSKHPPNAPRRFMAPASEAGCVPRIAGIFAPQGRAPTRKTDGAPTRLSLFREPAEGSRTLPRWYAASKARRLPTRLHDAERWVRTHCLSVSGRMPQRASSEGMSAAYPTASNHSSILAKSSLFARTAAIGIGW